MIGNNLGTNVLQMNEIFRPEFFRKTPDVRQPEE
jgi:hypothetical protein